MDEFKPGDKLVHVTWPNEFTDKVAYVVRINSIGPGYIGYTFLVSQNSYVSHDIENFRSYYKKPSLMEVLLYE